MRPIIPAVLRGLLALSTGVVPLAAADSCPQPGSEIATVRPDTTNSSLVVPQGTFQHENGVNISGRDGGQVFDGTNTRLRLGIAPCLEGRLRPNSSSSLGRYDLGRRSAASPCLISPPMWAVCYVQRGLRSADRRGLAPRRG
jgi:hypothetical protein